MNLPDGIVCVYHSGKADVRMDTSELVTCKHCRHSKQIPMLGYVYCNKLEKVWEEDEYCSRAEKWGANAGREADTS